MILSVIRGISKVVAAFTGLLFVYGSVYALEGMTTRLPTSGLHELLITTLWMLPWTVLFCSGFEDLGKVARQTWILWTGMVFVLAFLYYFERGTSSSVLTKTAMPLVATSAGLLPHIIQRIRFIFIICGLAAGAVGIIVLYFAFSTMFSASQSFATSGIASVVYTFGIASLATGVLTGASLRSAKVK
jgi:hypothetical protein